MTLFKNRQTNTSGFTLVELLVVISIISLLTSIVLSALSDARAKARDTRRLQDMRTIQTALNMYQNENGGMFPTTTSPITSTNPTFLQDLVNAKLLSSRITDPINSPTYLYTYSTYTTNITTAGCNTAKDKALLTFKLEKMTAQYPKSGDSYVICM